MNRFNALFLLLAAAPLHAANVERCVSSNAELAAALAEAQDTPVSIRLVQGSYDLRDTVWHGVASYVSLARPTRIAAGSRLLGGYTPGCGDRNVTTFNTNLVDSAIVDDTVGIGVQPSGDLQIEGLAFSARNGLSIFAGFASNPITAGSTIDVRRNAFKNAAVGGLKIFWARADDGGSVIRVVDNIIANNAQNGESQSLLLSVQAGAPSVDVVNNTIVGNPGPATSSGLLLSNQPAGAGQFELYNNILWGNGDGSRDLLSNTPSYVLYNNLIGARAGTSPRFETGTLGVDPKLNANLQPIQSPPSPVINTGLLSVPGGLPALDIDGDPRVTGLTVDRGAHESGFDWANVQTVSSANDSGAGSLRAAIASINASGGGTIQFGISGVGCPRVITLASELPALTASATIDATVQSGWRPNTLDVGYDGQPCVALVAGAGVANGLTVASGSNASVVVRGLAFGGFSSAAINFAGGRDHIVASNRFGGTTGGVALPANGTGVRLGATESGATVGGDDRESRNLVLESTGSGVVMLAGSTLNQIVGNYVGVGWNGALADRGNGTSGVYVDGPFNAVLRNLIGFNRLHGVFLVGADSHDNLVAQNRIGVGPDGEDIGNDGSGIRMIVNGGAPHDNLLTFNEIAYNDVAGVLVDAGRGNDIRASSIHNNTGLGIDLAGDGVDANDDDGGVHPVDQANRGQNYPSLSGGVGNTNGGTVSGTLTTTPGVYRVDFFNAIGCDASGNGEGRNWVGSAIVSVPTPMLGNQGTAAIAALIQPAPGRTLVDGSQLTATATDPSGNTSEFSACATYTLGAAVFADGFE